MPWIICAAAAWFAFLWLIDWERFKAFTWKAGLIGSALQLTVDWGAGQLGLYRVTDPVIPLLGSSALFTFGHVFAVTVLFVQYYPRDKILQAINIPVWAMLALIEEINLLATGGVIHYQRWSHFHSLGTNILALVFIAWAAPLVGALGRARKTV